MASMFNKINTRNGINVTWFNGMEIQNAQSYLPKK